jgi:hypothetical protein
MLKEKPDSTYMFDCTAFFVHVSHVPYIYRSLSSRPSRLITERIVRDCLEERAAMLLARTGSYQHNKLVAPSVVALFVATSLLALINWWVDNDNRLSPEEMQVAYESLVGGGLGAL